MASLFFSDSLDFDSITEVKRLAEKTVEQAIMLFSDGEEIAVLSGRKFGETCTEAPSMNMVINLVSRLRVQLREAVVFHNHPHLPWHGEIIPSKEDIVSTELLKWQLALLGIHLIDHIILSGGKKCSLRHMGLYNDGSLTVKGFELQRFLYCFLTQVSVILEHDAALDLLLSALEKKLELLSDYYDKKYLLRIWCGRPCGDDFKFRLAGVRCADPLLSQLIETMAAIDDDRDITVDPEQVRVYGAELQRKIIDREYRQIATG